MSVLLGSIKIHPCENGWKTVGTGVVMGKVAGTALRRIIETEPLPRPHGHAHGSKGACRTGTALCLNLGREYVDGILRGVIVDIDEAQVRDYLFKSG